MVLSQRIFNAYYQSITFILLGVFTTQITFAQKISHKPLLAAVAASEVVKTTFLQPNVIFPDLLKGNETEAMEYIQQYAVKKRDHLVSMYEKGKILLPKASEILKKYGLPEELKVMLALESGYNANAVSRAGAVGYWQIMDIVAKEYGMKYVARGSKSKTGSARKTSVKGVKKNKVAARKDDRRNFTAATTTAARYLTDRRNNLDENWLLVVASYNCGEGNVRRAIRKSGIKNPSFWEIKQFLPAETRAYVQNFIAMNVVYHNYELFLENKLRFVPQPLVVQPTLRDALMMNGPDYQGL